MKVLFNIFVFFGILMFSSNIIASPLVEVEWLNEKIKSGETKNNILLIDIRNSIGGGSFDTYLDGHIPSSIHSDYGKDGWRVNVDNTVGLVPSEEQFQVLAKSLGVNNDTHVIIIPAGVSSSDFGSAARSYWTFKVFGHDNVSVLNGGYMGWQQAYPSQIEKGDFVPRPEGNFIASFVPELYIGSDEVAKIINTNSSVTLLDGRTKEQFYAEKKHGKARIAGRLPGSELLYQENAYNVADNMLKNDSELKEVYADYLKGDVVSYCNTGHWAANNWFVISEVLGNKNVRLYDGSMVEWTQDPTRPVDTSGRSNMDKLKAIIG